MKKINRLRDQQVNFDSHSLDMEVCSHFTVELFEMCNNETAQDQN